MESSLARGMRIRHCHWSVPVPGTARPCRTKRYRGFECSQTSERCCARDGRTRVHLVTTTLTTGPIACVSSAGFQPAVSPTSSRQAFLRLMRADSFEAGAGWKPAIQQAGSLRYGGVIGMRSTPGAPSRPQRGRQAIVFYRAGGSNQMLPAHSGASLRA